MNLGGGLVDIRRQQGRPPVFPHIAMIGPLHIFARMVSEIEIAAVTGWLTATDISILIKMLQIKMEEVFEQGCFSMYARFESFCELGSEFRGNIKNTNVLKSVKYLLSVFTASRQHSSKRTLEGR